MKFSMHDLLLLLKQEFDKMHLPKASEDKGNTYTITSSVSPVTVSRIKMASPWSFN